MIPYPPDHPDAPPDPCRGTPTIAWFRSGTIQVWCSECDAEIVLPVRLPSDVEWIDTTEDIDDGGVRYPTIHPLIRWEIEAAAGYRYGVRYDRAGQHAPKFKPIPRVWMPT